LLRSLGAADVRFVYLAGTRALLADRLAQRRGHFMPPALLESQLATLEEPSPDEGAWVCDISKPADAIVADLMTRAS
jgi:gluconokinase